MSRKLHNATPLLGVLFLVGCSSGGAPPPEPVAAPAPVEHQPLDGANYLVYYVENDGLHVMNTQTGVDRIAFPVAGDTRAAAAPSGDRFVVNYRDNDSSKVVMIDGASGTTTRVHATAGAGQYTFAWSRDGSRLGVGHRSDEGSGVVVVVGSEARPHPVGCSTSDRFLAWRTDGSMIVADANNVYAASAEDCTTLATLPKRGKTDIVYSANGEKVSFLRNNRAGQAELWVANYNGAGAQTVAPYQYLPQRTAWAPDAGRIAFTLQSQQYANVTHVAVHDLTTGRATFDAEPTELGVPNDDNACWSPDGARIAFDRSYSRSGAGQSYLTMQKVVTEVGTGTTAVIVEELVRGGPPPVRCAWVGNTHLLVAFTDETQIVDVTSKATFSVPAGRQVLFAMVIH